MRFKQFFEANSNENKPVRWMTRSDLPQVIPLAAKRPEFEGMNYKQIEQVLIKSLQQRNVIGVVARDADDKVHGAAIYDLQPGHFNVSMIAADSQPSYKLLIDNFHKKMDKRNAYYIRAHNDPQLVGKNGLINRANGFETKLETHPEHGDFIVGLHYRQPTPEELRPKKSFFNGEEESIDTPHVVDPRNWEAPAWDQWHQALGHQTASGEGGPEQQWQQQLWANKPWKDAPQEDDDELTS